MGTSLLGYGPHGLRPLVLRMRLRGRFPEPTEYRTQSDTYDSELDRKSLMVTKRSILDVAGSVSSRLKSLVF